MNFGENNCLWTLITLLVIGSIGSSVLSSKALSGCGWPLLAAAAYCLGKNGGLSNLVSGLGGGCGCNN